MSQSDQAAGLRRWAESQPQSSSASVVTPSRLLMTLGLPEGADADTAPVINALRRWREQGQQWVGDPEAWRVVPLDVTNPHLPTLMQQQSRWALWVDDDADGFRRAYGTLKQLALHPSKPPRLLLVYPALTSGAGLLGNLRDAASQFLGIQLVMIRFPKRRGG